MPMARARRAVCAPPNSRHPARAAKPRGKKSRKQVVAPVEEKGPVRVRLTPSRPSRAGSVWYHTPLPVNKGFQTLFTFQVSDHSKECSKHKDPTFSLNMYESCAVHGGDGFAFVIHRDTNETAALVREPP